MDSTTGSGAREGRRGGDTYEWSSLRSGPFGTDQDVSGAHVTAVLVTFDAARWLESTLDGLEALEHRPNRLIAIDNGSSDATMTLLERARDRGLLDAVYRGKRGTGFGDAVRSALRQDRESSLVDSSTQALPVGAQRVPVPAASSGLSQPAPGHESRWLWLLHDDAIPAPDALR